MVETLDWLAATQGEHNFRGATKAVIYGRLVVTRSAVMKR